MCPYTYEWYTGTSVLYLVWSPGIRHALPYGALTCSTLLSISILFECWLVCARSRFHCYEHPPRCMVLIMDSSTLLISLVLLRVRDTLCDIHAGFCSQSFLSVYQFPLLYISYHFDILSINYDSHIYAQSATIWLVGNIPCRTLIELAKPPRVVWNVLWIAMTYAGRTHPLGFCSWSSVLNIIVL